MLKDWLVEIDTGDFDIEVTGFTSEDMEGFVGREVLEVDGTEYDVSRLGHVKCPACGHEWDA